MPVPPVKTITERSPFISQLNPKRGDINNLLFGHLDTSTFVSIYNDCSLIAAFPNKSSKYNGKSKA